MRIWPLSDLHIETVRGWDLPRPEHRPAYDVLVCAGDLMPGAARGIRWLAERVNDKPVVVIAGNHEFFGRDLDREIEKAQEAAAGTNVIFLQNQTAIVSGVLFVGATGWTDFELYGTPDVSMAEAQNGLNDYRKIRVNRYTERLRPRHTRDRHCETMAFIESSLRACPSDLKRVVVTHHPLHAYTGRSLPMLRGEAQDPLAPAYMSDAAAVFDLGVDAAISGHTHVSLDAIVGGATRAVSNAKGYGPWAPGERWQNPSFDPFFTFEI
jgi:predicted phosphodiesterase